MRCKQMHFYYRGTFFEGFGFSAGTPTPGVCFIFFCSLTIPHRTPLHLVANRYIFQIDGIFRQDDLCHSLVVPTLHGSSVYTKFVINHRPRIVVDVPEAKSYHIPVTFSLPEDVVQENQIELKIIFSKTEE